MLAPAVEAGSAAPHLLDDGADAAVAAAEQSFDHTGFAVVVAEADRLAVLLVGADRVAQLGQPRVGLLVRRSCAAHWNGVCGLGTNPPMLTVQRMSLVPLTSRPFAMTLRASSAIATTSSSVSVGSPHMK